MMMINIMMKIKSLMLFSQLQILQNKGADSGILSDVSRTQSDQNHSPFANQSLEQPPFCEYLQRRPKLRVKSGAAKQNSLSQISTVKTKA